MPQTRGMKGHVESKNPMLRNDSNEQLRALKIEQKNSKRPVTANTPASRDSSNGVKRKKSSGAETVRQEHRFYDTDGESFDVTTASLETTQHNFPTSHAPPHGNGQDTGEGKDDGEESESEDDEEEGEDDQDAEDDEELRQDPRQSAMRARGGDGDRRKSNNVQMRQIEGDSYPDTTSGRLTTTDAVEGQQMSNFAQTQQDPHQMQIRNRSTGTRLPLGHQRQQLTSMQQQPAQQIQGQPQLSDFQGRLSTDVNVAVAETAAAFKFAPAGRPNGAFGAPRPQPAGGQASNVPPSTDGAPTNVAQHGSIKQPNSAPPPNKQPNPAPLTERPGTPQQQGGQHPSKSKPRRKSAQTYPNEQTGNAPEQQQMRVVDNRETQQLPPRQPQQQRLQEQTRQHHAQQAPQPRAPQPQSLPQHQQPHQQQQQQAQFHEQPSQLELDYEPEVLSKMVYSELKDQSFDFDPRAGKFTFPEDANVNDLPQKLDLLTREAPHTQHDFFDSLDIDTWEEAGDWFLQRFAELAKNLKENRREKRKAVETLENEIAERHTAVYNKTNLTTAALSEMKESGGKVLQGTPKKTRKSK